MRRLEVVGALLSTYGAHGLGLRTLHEVRRRFGLFRAHPRTTEIGVSDRASPFAVGAEYARQAEHGAGASRAERVLAGEYEAFGGDWRRLPDTPRDWLRHPSTGREAARHDPWWRLESLDKQFGDIKELWEPARFLWAYDLIRGYLLTGQRAYETAFVDRLDAWRQAAPPFQGPFWACGQETSIRAVALLYAEANFPGVRGSPDILELLAQSAERIRDAIGYAVSQRNNHAISEAAGLICVGTRLSGLHPDADRWLSLGRSVLNKAIREQFAADGWYVQHSFNYLRVALDQSVIAERALRTSGQGLEPSARDRLVAAVRLLEAVIDPSSGRVPNLGANDGALVHPVSSAPFTDYRPTMTVAASLFGVPLRSDMRRDKEALGWMGLESPSGGPAPADGIASGPSGWAVARAGQTQVFMRWGDARPRPSHIDPLQLDIRLGGQQLVVDPGTFAYNAEEAWISDFAGSSIHNGPVPLDVILERRGPRFLWYRWPTSTLTKAAAEGTMVVLEGEIPGLAHRRVEVTTDQVRVVDKAIGQTGPIRVRWLLEPGLGAGRAYGFEADREYRAEPDSALGWYCPSYRQKHPAVCLERTSPEPIVSQFALADHRAP